MHDIYEDTLIQIDMQKKVGDDIEKVLEKDFIIRQLISEANKGNYYVVKSEL
jgi:hypothetical protein